MAKNKEDVPLALRMAQNMGARAPGLSKKSGKAKPAGAAAVAKAGTDLPKSGQCTSPGAAHIASVGMLPLPSGTTNHSNDGIATSGGVGGRVSGSGMAHTGLAGWETGTKHVGQIVSGLGSGACGLLKTGGGGGGGGAKNTQGVSQRQGMQVGN